MFNLVIAAGGNFNNIVGTRFLEYTEPVIKDQFTATDGSIDRDALAKLPTIMAPEFEEESEEMARVGFVSPDALFSLTESPFIPRFPAKLLLKSRSIVSLYDWENTRTHWAVKCGELFKILPKILGDEIVSSLRLTRTDTADPKNVAVMMPFEHGFDAIYEKIKYACSIRDLKCLRVDELYTPTDITDDISRMIDSSKTIIVDITGRNPNVMYELGLATALKRSTILIAQDISGTSLPFDISHKRVISYTNDKEGVIALANSISEALKSISL